MFKKMIFLTCLLLANIVFAFDAPIALSTGVQYASQQQIDFGTAQNAICVWHEAVGGLFQIVSARTTDAGGSWQAPVIVSTTDSFYVPKLTYYNSTNALCTWVHFTPNQVFVNRTDDGGATWKTETLLSAGNNSAIAYDEINAAAVCVWTNGGIIQGSRTIDDGVNWSPVFNISVAGTSIAPNITFDGSGHGICVWQESTGKIQASLTSDGGANWSALPIDVIGSGAEADQPQIAFVDQSGKAICTWFRTDGPNLVITSARTSNFGANWEPAVDISSPGAGIDYYYMQITTNGVSSAICAWYFYDGVDAFIQTSRSTDSGATWTAPFQISPIASFAPTVVFDGPSSAICAWSQSDGISATFHAARTTDSGLNWEAPFEISTLTTYGEYSNLAYNGSNREIYVWGQENLGSIGVIWASASTTQGPVSFSASGKQISAESLFQKDIVNQISWTTVPTASAYRVYDANNALLFQGVGSAFYDHNLKINKSYSYFVSWLDGSGTESDKVSVTIP